MGAAAPAGEKPPTSAAGAEVWLAEAAHVPTASWLHSEGHPAAGSVQLQMQPSAGRASTTLVEPASAGSTVISVASHAGFEVGDPVVISGGGKSETNAVAGFGSLVLERPLQNSYPVDTSINAMEAPPASAGLQHPEYHRQEERADFGRPPPPKVQSANAAPCIAAVVGSSAEAGRGRPTAGAGRHVARAAPNYRVFCVASAGRTMTLYHAGDEERPGSPPSGVDGSLLSICGVMPNEAKEEPATSVAKGTNTSFLLESELNRTFSTHVQHPRAEEITCVHAVDEENGAASMYCCARNGTITKRQLGRGDVGGVLAGHPGWASCALVVEDAIFVGSDDGKVREWEMSSGKFKRTMDSTRAQWADGKPAGAGSHAGLIVSLLAPQNGAAKTLFCGCNDGAVIVWDLADGRLKTVARDAAGHARSVRVLHDCPSDGSVFTGSNDSSVGKWDAFAGSRLWDLKPTSGWASCLLTWLPGQFLLVGCEDGSIKRRGLQQGESQQVSYVVDSLGKAHSSAVSCLVALQGPNWLFSGAGDGSIRKWNVETGELLQSLEGHQGSVMCMLACPAEEVLMTGASDATLRQWSMKTGKLLHTSQVPQGHVTGYLVTDNSVQDTPRAGAFGGLSMPTQASFVPAIASTDADKSRMKSETNGMYSRDQNNQLVVRSPAGHACKLVQVTAAPVYGESPGTCDNCGRSVNEGEWLYECSDSNWWHCSVCLPSSEAQPPAAVEGPGPFHGWMKAKFPVSAVMDKVKADVRERINKQDISPAMISEMEAQQKSREMPLRDLSKDRVIDQSELARALHAGQIAAPAGTFLGGQPASSSGGPASQTYYVSNLLLQTTAPGLGYRQSADLEDKFPDKRQARWGQVVTGVDMGNGFVRTTTGVIGYLPTTVQGHKVLIPSSELQGVAG